MMVAIRFFRLYVLSGKLPTAAVKDVLFVSWLVSGSVWPPPHWNSPGAPHAPECEVIMKSGFGAEKGKESSRNGPVKCRSTQSRGCVVLPPDAAGHRVDPLNHTGALCSRTSWCQNGGKKENHGFIQGWTKHSFPVSFCTYKSIKTDKRCETKVMWEVKKLESSSNDTIHLKLL